MSGQIPSDFTRPDCEQSNIYYAEQEVWVILSKLSKDHYVVFAPWVFDYAVFHWVHTKMISHIKRPFEGANGLQLLEETLRSCTSCAAQQGDHGNFSELKRLHGFFKSKNVPIETSSNSDF